MSFGKEFPAGTTYHVGPMVDFKVLLKKYIDFIVDLEGTDFLDLTPDGFTDREWNALIAIRRELDLLEKI